MDYEANHQGLYIDVCGVNPSLWGDYIDELGVRRNSLKAGIEVYKYYYDKYKDKKKALLKFKGVKNNEKVKKIVDKIIRLEKEYKKRLNELKSLN